MKMLSFNKVDFSKSPVKRIIEKYGKQSRRNAATSIESSVKNALEAMIKTLKCGVKCNNTNNKTR